MTIDKAIEILTLYKAEPRFILEQDIIDAIKLGIEALKRCKYISEHTVRWADVLLPGED